MVSSYPLVTLGSPYGIGYEIFLMTVVNTDIFSDHMPYCIGSKSVLDFFIKLLNIKINYTRMPYNAVDNADLDGGSKFVLIDIDDKPLDISVPGDINSAIDGAIAYRSIDVAARFVSEGLFPGIVTLPVSKKNINVIDPEFKGHTEFFQKKWNEPDVFMTFVSERLRVMLLSTHLALNEVSSYLTPVILRRGLETAIELKKKLGLEKKICLLGLNPHAGEDGLLGDEETWMKEVVKEFDADNMIEGPLPADTAFTVFNMKKYDLYIACYHDQGLIPFKMLAFEDGVNLSYGMKYIRTSVDHGTAVDLIGTGKANLESFKSAYRLAIKLS